MDILNDCRRIVVKIGTSTLTHDTGMLNIRRIERLAQILSDFKNDGMEIVLVSSGAVSAGIARVGLTRRPESTEEKQALAAVGQTELMRIYERMFASYGHTVGQILMTRDVVDNPVRLGYAKSTFAQLFRLGCLPIVNENDSVSCEEIQFGGNDTLSAYVAIVCDADLLINMSDVDGLYDSDPRSNPKARLIDRVEVINDQIRACAGGIGTDRGTGGMITKIRAAEIANQSGIPMLIVNGRDPECLYDIHDGKHIGTYFAANKSAQPT